MLDKKKLKAAADKLGMKVTFGSDNPGFFSKNDKKNYSFNDLSEIIDRVFPVDYSSDKNTSDQKQEILPSLSYKGNFKNTRFIYSPTKNHISKNNVMNYKILVKPNSNVIEYHLNFNDVNDVNDFYNLSKSYFKLEDLVFKAPRINEVANSHSHSNGNDANCLKGVYKYE